jgi:fructose-specific phosphotransferase system IIC component
MAHAGPDLDAADPVLKWIPNRKWIAWATANILGWVAGFVVTKLGIHETASAALGQSTVIGFIAGAVASYVVKEVPLIEKDIEAHS